MRLLGTGIIALSLFSAAVAAPNPVGKWNGKVQISMPPTPPNATPEQKAMMAKVFDGVKKMVIKLELKADKTFTVVSPNPGDGKPGKPQSGKWSQKGNTVTLTDPKGQPQEFTLSADGKTLSADLKQGAPGGARITFTRA